jgi:small subunit ribosomal protein S6
MFQYELTFLLNEEAELKTIKELITGLEGTVTKEEKWGEKQLSYPIKGLSKAHFYNWSLEMPKTKVMELRKKLNYNEKLIRHLLLAVEK